MMWMLLSLSALCVASALAAESPRRVAFLTAPQTAAQARDGGNFGGGHGGGHGGGQGGHGGGSYGSYGSYQKPYDSGSKGNMYYYYYPVEEQHRYPSQQSSGFGFGGGILGLLAAIFLPILVLGGGLLLLAAIIAAFGGRSLKSDDWGVSQWSAELERLLYTHIDLLEAGDCAPRLVCELAVRTQPYQFPGKEALISTVEQWVPEMMRQSALLLKKASLGAYDSAQCRKLFKCDPFLLDNLLQEE